MSAHGSRTGAPDVDWRRLEERLQGRVVPRGTPTYENDRRAMAWNARAPERLPDAIAHVTSERDVREAIRFARRHRGRVSVRGGGHHFSTPALRQGGLLLDLGGLKEVTVDTGTRTATVQPGVSGGELMAALAPQGLAFPVGHCRDVPLSGFLLAGGFGWNTGAWGPGCLGVKGVELVDARGEPVYADDAQSPDLYWAARGGGPAFPGVVTRFHLELHPLPAVIRTSTLLFRVEDLDAAAAWLSAVHGSLPPSVELIALVVSPPPEARVGGAPARVFAVTATAFADSERDARRWLAPFEGGPTAPAPIHREPFADTPFETLFQGMDAAFPAGFRYAADHAWSDAPPGELLARTRGTVLSPPSSRDFLLLAPAPPRAADAPSLPDMALSVVAGVYVGIYAVWDDPAQDGDSVAWVRSVGTALAPHRVGRYVGEADLEADRDAPRQCFSAPAWEKLTALNRTHDPEGLFSSFPEPGPAEPT